MTQRPHGSVRTGASSDAVDRVGHWVPTHSHLARNLIEGLWLPAVVAYESLVALHVVAADRCLSVADDLGSAAARAAAGMITGDVCDLAPDIPRLVSMFEDLTTVAKVPASIGVQGVEYDDATSLADDWLTSHDPGNSEVVVAGLRTGGAYLAPVVTARLRQRGVDARFVSVRPGHDFPRLGSTSHVLLVDDPPLTGTTILKALEYVGPGANAYVLVPVFEDRLRAKLEERADVPVIGLDRTRWTATRRLDLEPFASVLTDEVEWLADDEPIGVNAYVPDHGNSVRTPWQFARRRAAPRAAFEVRLKSGLTRRVVARWVPPGIFGWPARLAATSASGPPQPAAIGVGRSIILTEFIPPTRPSGSAPPLSARIEYVRHRATLTNDQRSSFPDQPDSTLQSVIDGLQAHGLAVHGEHLVRCLKAAAASLPDNRCQPDKWAVMDGRVIKFGGLDHPLRRDNQLMSSVIDLATLACNQPDEPLDTFADAVEITRKGGSHRTQIEALQVAILYYAVARGKQIPRMYTAAQSTTLTMEAIRTQQRVESVLASLGIPRTDAFRTPLDIGVHINLTPSSTTLTGDLSPLPQLCSLGELGQPPSAVGVLEDSGGQLFFYPKDNGSSEFVEWLMLARERHAVDWLGAPTLNRRSL